MHTPEPHPILIWARGWALSRGVAPPITIAGGVRIAVDRPDQVARFVFPEPAPAVTAVAKDNAAPFVFIKVCAPPAEVAPLLPAPWEIAQLGYFMTQRPRGAIAPPALRNGYQISVSEHGDVIEACVLADDGSLAARGRLAIVGDAAVYDQIVTEEAHRRRGLGRAIMAALGAAGGDCGAGRNLLVATDAGRALYEALGWRMESLYTTAAVPSGVTA